MLRLLAVAVCVVVGACSPTADGEPKTAANSVVIPDAPDATALDDTPAPSSNEGPSAAPTPEEDAPDEIAEDSPSGPSGPSGSTGGPLCDQAADCCLKILALSSKNPSLSKTCNTFRTAPTSACQSLLNALSQGAPQMGLSCP